MKEDSLIEEVLDVWKEIYKSLIADLELKQEPLLNFINNFPSKAVMSTKIEFSLANSVITSTVTIYEIDVNLYTLREELKNYAIIALTPKARRVIIKCLLIHECRHIWQVENNYFIGKRLSDIDGPNFNGYGKRAHETDANEYVFKWADNGYELILFKLNKMYQDLAGKLAKTLEEEKAIIELKSEIVNAWYYYN